MITLWVPKFLTPDCRLGMSRGSNNPRDDTPTSRPNVFLAPSQSSARLPAHVGSQANHPSLNPALFASNPPPRRLSAGDLIDTIMNANAPKDSKEIEIQKNMEKNLAKQKQKVKIILIPKIFGCSSV